MDNGLKGSGPEEEKILIVTIANKEWFIALLAMLNSCLLSASMSFHYDLRVICTDFNENLLRKIETSLKRTGRKFSLSIINTSKDEFSFFEKKFPKEFIYYIRLLIPDLVSKEYKRAIFVDADMIIHRDMSLLWFIPFDNYLLLGCQDYYIKTPFKEEFDENSYAIETEIGYVNGGLLVFNVALWVENHYTNSVYEYLEANSQNCIYRDQSLINVLFHKSWKRIDDKYNSPAINHEVNQARIDKINCHFIGPCKPWILSYYYNPHSVHFYQFLAQIGMGDWRPSRIKHHFNRFIASPPAFISHLFNSILQKAKLAK
jgi:lipopolysaccharide biosynthesis glycosyltransferase